MGHSLHFRATDRAGTIRLDRPGALPRVDRAPWRSIPPVVPTHPRVGLIHNQRSHRNRERQQQLGPFYGRVDSRAPANKREMVAIMAEFAESGIDLLIVDGGDGTVRDVLSAAHRVFGASMPQVAVLPSGKTNALAIDLGIPGDWSVDDVIAAAARGSSVVRSPIEVEMPGRAGTPLRGFLFGAGAFVRATSLAQHTHRWGLFNGFAVGLSLTLAIGQTFFGSSSNSWRRGEAMTLRFDDGSVMGGDRYLLLASTLEAMPLGLKPFGPCRSGMKLLAIDAPPRRMMLGVPAIIGGWTAPWLDRLGYHRRDADHVAVELSGGFILDGERFAASSIVLRRGAPVRFVVP